MDEKLIVKFLETDETAVYYSNTAQVSSSHYDFRVRFGQVKDDSDPKVLATVYLSPGHAKAFLRALSNQIDRFEAKFGEIPARSTVVVTDEDNAEKGD